MPQQAQEKHVSGAAYVATYAALLALATLSLGLSSIGGAPALPLAIVAAGTKAALVFWFFMHLAEERAGSRLAIVVAILLLVILLALSAADVLTRRTFPARLIPAASDGFYRR